MVVSLVIYLNREGLCVPMKYDIMAWFVDSPSSLDALPSFE